jgi:hypothetical protein
VKKKQSKSPSAPQRKAQFAVVDPEDAKGMGR